MQIGLVGQEMLHRSQQVGAEAASCTIDALETVSFEQLGKERVRKVACVVLARPIAPYERFDGAVVGIAQVAQRVSRFRRLTAGRENLGPTRGVKGIRRAVIH